MLTSKKLILGLACCLTFGSVQTFAQSNQEDFKAIININGEQMEFDSMEEFQKAIETQQLNEDIEIDFDGLENFNMEDIEDLINIEDLDGKQVQKRIIIKEGENGSFDHDVFFFDNGAARANCETIQQGTNKAMLGVYPDYSSQTVENRGVRISEVVEGSAAAAAGLQKNDYILSIDDVEVGDQALHHIIGQYEPNDIIKVAYQRGSAVKTVNVRLKSNERYEEEAIIFTPKWQGNMNCDSPNTQMRSFFFDDEVEDDSAFLGVYLTQTEGVEVINGVETVKSSANNIKITGICEDSGAEKAGLQEGDVILSINKEEIESVDELIEVITSYEIGDVVKVKYERNGKVDKVKATLGEKKCGPSFEFDDDMEWLSNTPFKRQKQKLIIKDENGVIEEELLEEDVNVFIIDSEEEGLIIEKEEVEINGEKVIKIRIKMEDLNEEEKAIINKGDSQVEKEELSLKTLAFYPNPNEGRFTVDFESAERGDITVRILDISGKEVYRDMVKNFKGAYSNDVDISDQEQGTYILQISQNGKEITKKIILN